MTFDQLLQWTLAAICAVGGWFLRELWQAVQKLRSDLSDLEKDLPEHYVQKVDYKDDINRVHNLLDKIYDKLDKKADK
jgi:divalent metal cation (Fe/Co/Zn/Cd) transporter